MMLYRLGMIPWQETQAMYHTLAEAEQEALVLCRPDARYVCLGFHDDLEQEVNRYYCSQYNIPLIRRETGGGMVLLDKDQIFFQLILHKDNPLLVGRRDRFFHRFLGPAVAALGDFGLKAVIQPPADILVNGRKISGNGAGDINGYAVYIGNLLLGFDRPTMANIFQTPNPALRQYARKSMEQYMTTMSEELGYIPLAEQVEEQLLLHFRQWIPDLVIATDYSALKDSLAKAAERLMSAKMLSLPGKKIKARNIKIKEDVFVRLHRYDDGRHRGSAIMLIEDGVIRYFDAADMEILQQENMLPLAPYLTGASWSEAGVRKAVQHWCEAHISKFSQLDCELLIQWVVEGIT